MRIDLDDAEQLQRFLVDPVVAGVRREVKTLVDRVNALEDQGKKQGVMVRRLVRNQGRALAGMAGVTALVSLVFGFALDWARKRLGL